jgi:hypothetical protein
VFEFHGLSIGAATNKIVAQVQAQWQREETA